MNPTATETAKIIVETAYQAVADKAGVTYAAAVALVNSDDGAARYWLSLVRAAIDNAPRLLSEMHDAVRS